MPPKLRIVIAEDAAIMRDGLNQTLTRRGLDVVAAVAGPYPALTIATVLGAPHEDAGRLHGWSTWVQRQFDIRALGAIIWSVSPKVNPNHGPVPYVS